MDFNKLLQTLELARIELSSQYRHNGIKDSNVLKDITEAHQQVLELLAVSGSLPEKFADIIRFIESDLMEVKLYGNDGFDNQEELDGKDYLVQLIKEAVGNDR